MARKRNDRPNVVIFFTDQQRHDSTGVHGNPLGLTPHFDRVATAGTHLYHAFTCAPVCGPARACLQTGTHITTNGAMTNGLACLDPKLPTLAQCFNEAGYRTGYIGKWHLSNAGPNAVPREQRGGYQDWLGANCLEHTSDTYRTGVYDEQDREVLLPGYRVDALTDAGIRYIDKHQDEPFFLMMSFLEPHHQNHVDDYPPPTGYRQPYEGQWMPPDLAGEGGSAHAHLGGYWGMIKRLDEAFGRVLDALKSLSLDQDTIVLFTSDHACHFKTRNDEYKRSCHDNSIRIPMLLTGPGFDAGGQRQEMVSLVDLPPTLLDAAGLDVPSTMEGRSIHRLIHGQEPDWPQEMFVQVCDAHPGRAVRTRRWKYCVMASPQVLYSPARHHETYEEAFLYDLQHDPHELTNLIHHESHVQVKQVMRERLIGRMTALGEPKPTIVDAKLQPAGQRKVTEAETLE